MNKTHIKYLAAFAAGTFFGGYVLGIFGRILGKA
jgi:hypothetical protein